MLTRLRMNKIKTGPNAGKFMGRFVLADLDGDVGILLFSDQLEKNRRLLVEDTVVLVTGQVRESSGDIELLEEATASEVEVELALKSSVSMAQMLELRNLLTEHPGQARVVLRLALPQGEVRVAVGEQFRVKLDDALLKRVAGLLGDGRVTTRIAPRAMEVPSWPDESEISEPEPVWSEA